MQKVARFLAAVSLFATAAIAADFKLEGSADFENTHRGGTTTKGKLYALDKRIRTENEGRGMTVSMIMDTQAKKMWMLIGPRCVEQSLAGDPHRTSFLIPDKSAVQQLVGKETIDGHPTEKYKVTTSKEGATLVHFVWRAKDLKGFPIQTSDEAGTSVTTFKNIALEKPDAKLFRPPAGCKSVNNLNDTLKRLDKHHH